MGPYTWKIEFPNEIIVWENRRTNPTGISGATKISLIPKNENYPLVEVDIPKDAVTFCSTGRVLLIGKNKIVNSIYKIGYILEGKRYCLCVDDNEKKIWKEVK